MSKLISAGTDVMGFMILLGIIWPMTLAAWIADVDPVYASAITGGAAIFTISGFAWIAKNMNGNGGGRFRRRSRY